MELWIRNQDRENIVKVGLLEINERENDYAILTIYENRIAILGLYKTKERALEVLDEIQHKLDYIYELSLRPRALTTIEHKIVYEMPID